MTKKRRQENLEYLLSIEQEMTSQGKRLLLTRTSSLELIEN